MQAAATSALRTAQRSHPTSEVRGKSWEDPMPEGRRPRGVTQRPRSGAAAESARLRWCRNGGEELPKSEVRGGSQEELPHAPMPEARGGGREELPYAQGQGRRPGGPTPYPRPGAAAGRSYPTPKDRGGGWEDQPHIQGAVAARAQEGLEELSHVEGQEGWP